MNSNFFLTISNIVLLLVVMFILHNICLTDCGKVISGENWTAKRYGSKYILSIKTGSDVNETLEDFAKKQKIQVGNISGIGAVNSATLRFYNPATQKYVTKTFNEQMEISNLTGNISMKDGKQFLHIHVTLGKSDYSTIAGHLLTAKINGAGEFWVEDLPTANISRTYDNKTGLQIFDF